MRKTIVSILTAVALCISLAGCSGDEGDNTTRQEQTTTAATDDILPPVEESEPQESEPIATTTAAITEETTASAEPETVEQPEESEPENIYAGLITAYDNTYLGLPQKDKVYIFSDKDATAEINGELCHAVSCYDEYEGALYFMCDYYITEDGGKVYRYYEVEDRYELLPEGEEELFPALDPTTQTPEEIFAVANELYGIFTFPDLECDPDVYFEIDGSTYYLLLDERFDTMQELIGALDRYFSQEIVNSLMDTNQFRLGEDGRMYYCYLVWSTDAGYVSTEYELTTLTEDTAVFTAYSTYEYEAGLVEEKVSTYTAQKAYGVWRFTSFEPYRIG